MIFFPDKMAESKNALPPNLALGRSGGYRFQSLEGAKDSSDKGKWRVHIVILSGDGGGLPCWALEMGLVYGTLETWHQNASNACSKFQTCSSSNSCSVLQTMKQTIFIFLVYPIAGLVYGSQKIFTI